MDSCDPRHSATGIPPTDLERPLAREGLAAGLAPARGRAMNLLAEALLDERAERFEEVLSIPGWEGTEEILLNSVNHRSPLTDLALSGLGDGDDSCAAVGLGGSALRESSRLQLIDRDDHRRLVQADQLGELLLRVLACDCRREDVEVPVGDAQRAERCVDL